MIPSHNGPEWHTDTRLDSGSFQVTADPAIDAPPSGTNLAARCTPKGGGVFEWKLKEPVDAMSGGTLTVLVKDPQGNATRIDRSFSVGQ